MPPDYASEPAPAACGLAARPTHENRAHTSPQPTAPHVTFRQCRPSFAIMMSEVDGPHVLAA